MEKMYRAIRNFAGQEDGATAVEYGMMVGLIAVAIIVAVAALGTQLNTFYGKIKDCLTTPATCGT